MSTLSAPGLRPSEAPRPVPLTAGPYVHAGDEILPRFLRGSVLMLGNFDGLHLGHRALVEEARRICRERGGASLAVMACEPHPRRFFAPETPPFRLSCGDARHRLLARAGADLIYAPRFDAAFAGLPPEDFVGRVLVAELGVSAVVCGRDFRFGARRAGDVAMLEHVGRTAGFSVHVLADVCDAGERVSSSAVRACIVRGDIAAAVEKLGAPWVTPVDLSDGALVHFDRDQILPPAGGYPVEALDGEKALATARILIGTGRVGHAHLPAGTTALRWR